MWIQLSGNATNLALGTYATVNQVQTPCKYHQGTGQTIVAKKLQVDICNPKVFRIDVVAAQESGIARRI